MIAAGTADFEKGYEPAPELTKEMKEGLEAYVVGRNLEQQAEDKEGEEKAKLLKDARASYLKAAEKKYPKAEEALERLNKKEKE